MNGQNEMTTKISVAIAGILERYTYNIMKQDAPHKDKIIIPPLFSQFTN
jgi:hypothetical protein